MGAQSFEKEVTKIVGEISAVLSEMAATHKRLVALVQEMPLMQQVTVQRALNNGWMLSQIDGDKVKLYNQVGKSKKWVDMWVMADGSYTR
ncbi:hypothetical protein [Vibrio phage vB_VpS_PG28]|nr:hypothetical protein [Vibrio phage vB_VpS_PG28]